MRNKNFVLSMVFMAAMVLFLLVGTLITTGTMYAVAAVLGFACMFVSSVFWCRFELPKMGDKIL